jgi:hypothetical protein
VISLTQSHLPDNTQWSQETDIHVPGGIQTHSPNKGAAAGPRLRPHGHWVRTIIIIITDTTVPIKEPDTIIRDNEEGTCVVIDVAISGNGNIIKKEAEKILECNTSLYKY